MDNGGRQCEGCGSCIDLRTVHDSTCFYNSFGETSENSQPILVGGFKFLPS